MVEITITSKNHHIKLLSILYGHLSLFPAHCKSTNDHNFFLMFEVGKLRNVHPILSSPTAPGPDTVASTGDVNRNLVSSFFLNFPTSNIKKIQFFSPPYSLLFPLVLTYMYLPWVLSIYIIKKISP
jgi:hypothetical protein